MIVEANGIKLHYTVEGRAGAPWVTFVTGMANDIPCGTARWRRWPVNFKSCASICPHTAAPITDSPETLHIAAL